MARSGHITQVVFDDTVNLEHIAGLCAQETAFHKLEVETAVADIISLIEQGDRHSELVFYFHDRIDELESITNPPESSQEPGRPLTVEEEAELAALFKSRVGCGYVLTVSIDWKLHALRLRINDQSDGMEMVEIVNQFEHIRRGLASYRKSIGRFGITSFNDSRKAFLWSDLQRADTHFDILTGWSLTGPHLNYVIEFQVAKKIGTLISVLFPKGPEDDWHVDAP
jgi:hypothetical protein